MIKSPHCCFTFEGSGKLEPTNSSISLQVICVQKRLQGADRYKPDLGCCHQILNYSADYPAMRTAAKLNVPVVALVSSWDNLTSGLFPFSLNRLVVWNEVLKAEAVDCSPPADKIEVTAFLDMMCF